MKTANIALLLTFFTIVCIYFANENNSFSQAISQAPQSAGKLKKRSNQRIDGYPMNKNDKQSLSRTFTLPEESTAGQKSKKQGFGTSSQSHIQSSIIKMPGIKPLLQFSNKEASNQPEKRLLSQETVMSYEYAITPEVSSNIKSTNQNDGVSISSKQPSLSFTSAINYIMELFGKKSKSSSQEIQQNNPSQALQPTENIEVATVSSQQQKGETHPDSSVANSGNSIVQSKMLHKRQKRKHFVFGTVIFGILAMVVVKIIKMKEDKSESFRRSGVSVPLEQFQN